MPLIVPCSRYQHGDLVVAVRAQTMFGPRTASICTMDLVLGLWSPSKTFVEIETWYGYTIWLDGTKRARDYRYTENWDATEVQVIGAVFGPLDLDDPHDMRHYLNRVYAVIGEDLREQWYWNATRTKYDL